MNLTAEWTPITEIRRQWDGIPRKLQDGALRDLALAGEILLAPAANQKTLTADDRAAAVWFGNEHNHLVRKI